MTDPTETARALLYRHNLPEDVIDGALCLHAQELAAAIREETERLKADGVLEPDKYRPCRDAANQIDPTRSEDDTDLDEAGIDRMLAAGTPVQIVTAPPGTFTIDPNAPSLEFVLNPAVVSAAAPFTDQAAGLASFVLWLDASDGSVPTHDGVRWPDGTTTIHHRHFGITTTHHDPEAACRAAHGEQGRIVWPEPAPADRAAADAPVKQRADCTELEWAEQERARFERLYTRESARADLAEQRADTAARDADIYQKRLERLSDGYTEQRKRAEAMERAMESTAADALAHRGCHRDLMAQCLRAERAEAELRRLAAEAPATNTQADEGPLAVARATNQRLNYRAQRLEAELAAYRRAVAQWEISERGTYIPHSTLRAIGLASGKDILGSVRHLKHFDRVEQAEARLDKVRDWVTGDVVTARNEFGNGYREAQRDIRDLLEGAVPAVVEPAEAADETPFTPPAHYQRDDGVDCCVHTIPVGPNSCPACRELHDDEEA